MAQNNSYYKLFKQMLYGILLAVFLSICYADIINEKCFIPYKPKKARNPNNGWKKY